MKIKISKCLQCKKNFKKTSNSKLFCCFDCRKLWGRCNYTHKCLSCKKLTFIARKFCSYDCCLSYHKKHKSWCYNPKFMDKAHKTCKERKVGFWDPKVQSEGGKIGGLRSTANQRKNKTGPWFNHDLHVANGRKGGKITAEQFRHRRNIVWNKIHFGSHFELKVAKYLIETKFLNKIIEGKNFQVCVDSIWIDFLLIKYKTFLEPHNFVKYHKNMKVLTRKEYHNWRRKILNKNGYKDYKVFVIENMNELKTVLDKLK